jgi:hypothetical protein
MTTIRETEKKYCTRAMTSGIILSFALIVAGQSAFGKGLMLGTLFSTVNFVLMGEALPYKWGLSKRKSFVISLSSMLLRYVLLAVPLVIAAKYDQFHMVSTVVGIFMIQAMILFDQFSKHLPTRKTNTRE